jgi:cardiolipin synthase A/B
LPGFSDSWLALHGGRSHYESLLVAGVRIYEHRDALLHAKTVVIDGVWSTIGSSNIDWRSFCHNDEINAIVIGEDFGAEMVQVFNDDLAHAVEVTAQAWRARGTLNRVRERIARSWEQLL